jgi:hypothetical protein
MHFKQHIFIDRFGSLEYFMYHPSLINQPLFSVSERPFFGTWGDGSHHLLLCRALASPPKVMESSACYQQQIIQIRFSRHKRKSRSFFIVIKKWHESPTYGVLEDSCECLHELLASLSVPRTKLSYSVAKWCIK